MIILDRGTEIHLVCERRNNHFHDRTTMQEGATTLDTAGGNVPIEEMGRVKINAVTAYPCVVDPLATHSLFSVALAEKDGWHNEQGGEQATLCDPKQHHRIPLSKFDGLHVLEDASSMLACTVEATKIKIMAGDELLCLISKMTEIEQAIQPFHVRDGVSLETLATRPHRFRSCV